MSNQLDLSISEITEKVNYLKQLDDPSQKEILIELLDVLAKLNREKELSDIEGKQESNLSQNFSCSFNESSLSIENISRLENLFVVKKKNFELKQVLKNQIQNFHATSKEFISNSANRSHKSSVILGELESIKKTLNNASDESKVSRAQNDLSFYSRNNDNAFQDIYKQINLIQQEIIDASKKIQDIDMCINETERENQCIKKYFHSLEVSMKNLVVEDGEKEGKNCSCNCEMF